MCICKGLDPTVCTDVYIDGKYVWNKYADSALDMNQCSLILKEPTYCLLSWGRTGPYTFYFFLLLFLRCHVVSSQSVLQTFPSAPSNLKTKLRLYESKVHSVDPT